MQETNRYIYVLLSRTHTLPARLIRLFTGEPYSHTSIALDIELKEMYSFARKHIHNPFDCGFVEEDIETGIFGMDKNVYCSVYEVPVTETQYRLIQQEIERFIKNREIYRYNYTGLVGVMFGKNVVDGKHFFCSQFVSHIFYKSGIKLFSKENGLIRPYDFHIRLKDKQIYNGKLSEYRSFLKDHQGQYLQEEYARAI
ncbi:MAG: hypothetical protein ACI4A3_06580 [Lachnospiraceae bacterium]